MLIEKLCSTHLGEITRIALDNYKEELNKTISLPLIDNAFDVIYSSLSNLADNELGVVAIEDGKLIGYLTGIPVDNMFGNVKGIFCPIHAHGAIKENRKEIYQRLYQKVAEIWVSNDIFTHSIALYAHDIESVNTFFWNGFGLRCVDAVRTVEQIETKTTKYDIRQISPGEAELIHSLELKLVFHINSSPVFMPIYKKLSVENLANWLSYKNNYIWAAFDEGKAVAYIKLNKDGENFITESADMMNICGAYTIEHIRGTGVSAQLLSYALDFLNKSGVRYCGVDFESLNLTASRFWMKHFEAYTFSVVRRIDERIKSHR
jgi:GNAT superfamily N-acetyltransferase